MFHPRNRHQGHYDLTRLKAESSSFSPFVIKNKYGNESIDFADPKAVLELNRALLKNYYGVLSWEIPKNSLCPPIPGRADYVHVLADLLTVQGEIPRGKKVRILDIGVGASCIYPIIGFHEYGWSFVGTDINPISIQSATKMLKANPSMDAAVELRLQTSAEYIFEGMMGEGEHFHATICNPPFHASMEDAQAGTRRKLNNLAKGTKTKPGRLISNFGGEGAELWCEGGEFAFIRRMVQESVRFSMQCDWFSTLVSKEDHLPKIEALLKNEKVREHRILDMSQGQKKSRVIAWRFS